MKEIVLKYSEQFGTQFHFKEMLCLEHKNMPKELLSSVLIYRLHRENGLHHHFESIMTELSHEAKGGL